MWNNYGGDLAFVKPDDPTRGPHLDAGRGGRAAETGVNRQQLKPCGWAVQNQER